MTYCPPHNEPQEYEFTALSAADILSAGDTNLNCGDCFDMPLSATVCITVLDNDTTLSGDAWRNESGDDRSYQTADIMVGDELVHGGAKIYAEEYYVLHGSDGNCYYLIEIELAGDACADDTSDFYAFYGDVPPAGVTLTVAGVGNVCGNWLDYRDMSAGLKWEFDDEGKLTVEAEDMALKGYKVDDVHAASGGEVIKLKKAEGEASLVFGAETGTYDVEIAYIDECDGEGEIEVWLNDVLVHTIVLDQNNNGNGNDWSSISTVTIEDLAITQGDELTLRGQRDAWEFARIDAITFCANEPPVAVDDAATTDEDTPVTLDLLANDSDPDGDDLTVVLVDGQAPGEFGVSSAAGRAGVVSVTAAGMLTFTPTSAFDEMQVGETDTVQVTYVIDDGNGATAEATATITVEGVNDAPIAEDDFFTIGESELATLDILLNDSDPEDDPLTVTLLSEPIEGAISLNADGTVAFDPGTDFLALQDGQTATVSFLYEISDGELTDTATVTVQIIGEGVCIPETVVTAGTGTLVDGTDLTVTLESPDITKDGTADFRFSVDFGDIAQDRYNFVFVIDVSGSTGVDDSFGTGVTVLEAEVQALQALTEDILALGLEDGSFTISIVPFSTSVQIIDFNPNDQDFNFVQTFGDDEALDSSVVDASLDALSAGGETNYLAAVFAAAGTIQQLELAHGDANNIVHFLSDGNPFPENSQPPFLLDIVADPLHAQASVHAIGVGSLVADTTFLDPLDNTGGAEIVADTGALNAALRDAPFEADTVLGATLSVFNDAGNLVDTLDFAPTDFTSTPLGYELSVEGVTGLDVLIGQTNTAQLAVELDGDGDLVADDTILLDVDIEGQLPLSTDL